MTVEHANRIVGGVEVLLTEARPIAQKFHPLSRTGASSREELAHAMLIVVAETFLAASSPKKVADFEAFAKAAGSSLWHVLFLQPCIPAWELERISTLDPRSPEAIKETIRLSEFARNDGMMKMETIESFLSFLRTLDTSSDNYWPIVYRRLGLVYVRPSDSPILPSSSRPPHKSWWRVW